MTHNKQLMKIDGQDNKRKATSIEKGYQNDMTNKKTAEKTKEDSNEKQKKGIETKENPKWLIK